MAEKRMLDEQAIGDIILCDPITRTGKEALDNLKLTTKDVSPSFFYEKLRVASKYDEGKKYQDGISNQMLERNRLYYQYTVDFEQFKSAKNRLTEFNTRFVSDSRNEYPLLMLGVAGNGKTIEVNRRIRDITSSDSEFEEGKAYLDLEEAFTKKTYGITYICPDYNSSLWLFCIKLLDGIMQYIMHSNLSCPTILNNFNNIIVQKNLANDEQKQLFQSIGNYRASDIDSETEVFRSLTNLLHSQHADKDIETLFETLLFIMYCSDPNKKHYIIIDNIEQYIKLNKLKIQIPNSDITTIYRTIDMVVMNKKHDFNRIEEDLIWKAFKIIIVLRRTSLGLLDPALLQAPVKTEKNITDVTGHFQIPDIWEKKKKYIWEEKLKDKFESEENANIIRIVDTIMGDGRQAVGTSYQLIIAPLMSHGIRRNARAQAHAAYKTYEILSDGEKETLNIEEFNALIDTTSSGNSSVRYMFRRALIEFQFKWSISSGNQSRWEKLNIGHLTGKKVQNYSGKKFMIEGVAYDNPQCVTLARRILTFLSCFPEENNNSENGKCKSVVDMFSTLSLYDVIKGVLINPIGGNTITKDDFQQFARVLIALSDMSNGETKSAPYVILGIKDENFHKNTSELVLAELLSKIWKAGSDESLPGKKYNCSDYGVRITDAGHSFLLDWQASFSFMAALHCFTIPSLFFLKDISSIKYVIETVYNASFKLCEMYEEEAMRFCGAHVTLKRGTYLPKHNDKYVTFKQRVKELHMNHLNLYRDFIINNYVSLSISRDDMVSLASRSSGFICKYIDMYDKWDTTEGASQCF